jgi:hypothetical protein
MLGLFVMTALAFTAGNTTAQAPAWTKHSVSASAPTEALACAAARDKAATHARAHLGLNLGACRCRAPAKGQERTCRIEYEVLEKG